MPPTIRQMRRIEKKRQIEQRLAMDKAAARERGLAVDGPPIMRASGSSISYCPGCAPVVDSMEDFHQLY